jgi:type IV secretion system protein VirB4
MGHLLDAKQDTLGIDSFMVFEIEELMNLGDKNLIPVLLYIFHRIEKSFTGQPALLILDEAWVMLGHPVFREKIREWLKVLRKANCAVLLATQSLSDAVRSGLLDVLSESCPTKIYLANGSANDEDQKKLYKGLGLNSTQIQIISSAAPKRDYYIVSPEGRRLINLALGPVALSFVGSSDKGSITRIKEMASEHGAGWPEKWLEERRGDFR